MSVVFLLQMGGGTCDIIIMYLNVAIKEHDNER